MILFMSISLLLIYPKYYTDAASINDRVEEMEIAMDKRVIGIREVIRVKSLENCLQHCRQCGAIVHYPDNVCIIFNKFNPIVLSSFGAICCLPGKDQQQQMECARCDKDEVNQDEVEGATNLLNVWTRNPLTNISYKVIPYDCQLTPNMYENLCNHEHGHLASIHSQQEDIFISSLAINSCHCKHIGLYSTPTNTDEFKWRDGTRVNYLNWKNDEPFGAGPHCAYIWQTNGWISGKCTDAYGGCCAVCQKNH